MFNDLASIASRRRAQLTYAFGLVFAIVAVLFAFGGGAAHAAVFPAPTPPHNIFVLTSQDAITTVQNPGAALTVNVLRNGVTIGSASGTADATGTFQVNHPGGVCFTGSTPLLQAGDVVQVLNGAVGEQTTVQNVFAGPAANVGGVITVHGTAADPLGAPLPIASLEARLTSKTLFSNGKRDIRAGVGVGVTGVLTYDAPGSTAWTATWSGLSAGDQALAMGAAGRGIWLGAVPAALNEITQWDVGFVPAPAPFCAAVAPLSAFSVLATDHPLYNVASSTAPIVISGTAANATAPTITLDDANPLTAPITITPTIIGSPFAATWTASFSPAQVATLTDGTLTATGSFTDAAGNVVPGGSITMTKDTTPPAAPTITPVAGTYVNAQSASLADADPTATIRYTTNNTAPTATSTQFVAGSPIPVPTNMTVQAQATDPAGNTGPVTTAAYNIVTISGVAASRPTVNIATSATPLDITGSSVNATAFNVVLNDTNAATPAITVPATVTGLASAQTWKATFSGAQLQSLSDGQLTATVMVGTTAAGSTSVVKDTVAPPVPVPSLAPGTYQDPRTLVFSDSDVLAEIHYAVNGTASPLTARLLPGDLIPLAEGTTTVTSMAVDALGNTSPVGSFAYTIVTGTSVSPATSSVGSAVVAQTSGAATFVLANTSPHPFTFLSATLGGANPGDFALGGTCAGSPALPAGGSCTVTATMTPTAVGARSASIVISDTSPTGPHTVIATGTGIAQTHSIVADTALVDFLKIPTGTVTAPHLVTITSTGNTAVTVGTPVIGGANANQFVITSNNCGALPPGAKCQIGVEFAPTVKANAAGTLTVPATLSSTSVALKGVGDAPLPAPPAPTPSPTPVPGAAPVLSVSVSPTTLQFNKVVLNTTSTQTITVTSTGNTATPVIATLGGANANQYTLGGTCATASPLAPGATCTLSLTFHPTVRANANATITITGPTVASTITVKGSVK